MCTPEIRNLFLQFFRIINGLPYILPEPKNFAHKKVNNISFLGAAPYQKSKKKIIYDFYMENLSFFSFSSYDCLRIIYLILESLVIQ